MIESILVTVGNAAIGCALGAVVIWILHRWVWD